MPYHADNETRDLILKLAATPAGFTPGDYKGPLNSKAVSQRCYGLCHKGLLFAGRRGQRNARYFTTHEAALKWGRANQMNLREPADRVKAYRAEFNPADAPANTVKVTVCPSFNPDLRWAPTGPFERVITADWMLRRQQAGYPLLNPTKGNQ